MRRLAVLVIGVVLVANVVFAEDYNPPPWTRGGPGTTYQKWEFGASGVTPPADEVGQGNPGPSSLIVHDTGTATVWMPTVTPAAGVPEASGVWKIGSSDSIEITIQNFDEQNPYKEIWLQMAWWSDENPVIYATVPGGTGELWPVLVDQQSPGWNLATWKWHIEPNPEAETIIISPGLCALYVDQIVIDTICVPEPTTICLLGLGALALLRKRRP
ncbi:MAG TPA: PEP-CTERM sorting domain-containing protein [Sedimentisphaerales bacterium]|nr:PEP-CTERM sorting domain-containing protein [Sedimentisphaerales bacterium]